MAHRLCALACGFIILACSPLARAQNQPSVSGANPKGTVAIMHATGTFEVKLIPQTSADASADPDLGRMTIDKQFRGALEGTSKGQMLTAGSPAKGSAGYVAIEKVTGTLNGRHGTFVLQHNATITRGKPDLNIVVVPDSGTDQLVGLAGKMTIIITDGKHSYDFAYTLTESQ
jgi:Protein of unknown function (DUF3224)